MLANLMQHQMTGFMPKTAPQGHVHQIFGFDILLDKDYKAWILEINDHPSFNVLYSKDFMGSKKEDEVLSFVDLHVKKTVTQECLRLVEKDFQGKLELVEDRYKGYERIYPSQNEDF